MSRVHSELDNLPYEGDPVDDYYFDNLPEPTLRERVALFIRFNTLLWVWEDRARKVRGWYRYIFLSDVRRLIWRIRDPKGYREWENAEPPF